MLAALQRASSSAVAAAVTATARAPAAAAAAASASSDGALQQLTRQLSSSSSSGSGNDADDVEGALRRILATALRGAGGADAPLPTAPAAVELEPLLQRPDGVRALVRLRGDILGLMQRLHQQRRWQQQQQQQERQGAPMMGSGGGGGGAGASAPHHHLARLERDARRLLARALGGSGELQLEQLEWERASPALKVRGCIVVCDGIVPAIRKRVSPRFQQNTRTHTWHNTRQKQNNRRAS